MLSARKIAEMSAGVVAACFMLGGCASVSVDAKRHQQAEKPDFILVNNFAVKPNEVMVDQGVGMVAAREAGLLNQTDEEVKIGRIAAETMATKLVAALRDAGIKAYRAGDNVKPTTRTVIVGGRFLTVDQGNRTLRVAVGFGLGRTELRTQVVAYQNRVKIAEAETSTGSAPQPGVAVSLGAGAVAGSVASAAVGAGTGATANEMFMSTVEADSQRTAKELAARIVKAYRNRGWLPPE